MSGRDRGQAFGWGAAIGTLGGLIGLGGAEFRLPVLMGPFRLAAYSAVQLNLLISLVTLLAAAAARAALAPTPALVPHLPEIVALMLAATAVAWLGAGLLGALKAGQLTRIIALVLAGLGVLLLAEAAFGDALAIGAAEGGFWRVPAGMIFGALIGLVSSLLGVAGGELIIPTLLFVFGLDIRAAGTASVLISLPAVAAGVLRHARAGAWRDATVLRDVGAPMAVGSILGASAGAALLPWAPAGTLKALLGAILLVAAAKLWRKARVPAPRPA